MSKSAKATKQSKSKQPKRKRRKRLISPLRLRRLAFGCANLAEADLRVHLRRPLADIVAGDTELAAAWQRGQFLRNLERAAGLCASMSRAASYLKIAAGGPELRRMLDRDDEARDLFDRTFTAAELEIRAAVIASAKDGNSQAIKTAEKWIADGTSSTGPAPPSFSKVTTSQLMELFDVTRQAIDFWVKKKACPRSVDGTFVLRDVIAWHTKYIDERARSGKKPVDINPMQTVKMRRYQVELDRELGRLLEQDSVVAGFVARFQLYAGELAKLPRDVAPLLENQPLLRIRKILEKFVDGVLEAQKKLPDELKLPPAAADDLERCLENLL
jgi:hypothetical protein